MKRALLALVLFALGRFAAAGFPAPDWILHSGEVVTVDANFRVVEAVAIYDGKIVALGGNEEVRKLAGAETRLVDLGGRTVVPGIIREYLAK